MKKLLRICTIMLLFFFYAGCSTNSKNNDIDEEQYKDKLISVAKRAYDRSLTFGTGGDISLRIPDKDYFIIKETGESFGDLTHDDISTVSLTDGKVLFNSPTPSHETDIHRALYNMKPEINSIMHIHAPYTIAWATCGKLIPAITQQSYEVLKDQKIIPYYAPGSDSLLTKILDSYDNAETSTVLMENHGCFVIGENLDNILYKAEVIENTARIAYLTIQIGDPVDFRYEEPLTYKLE